MSMQYLLSEEEFKTLAPKDRIEKLEFAIRTVRDFLMPGKCIHDEGGPEYCDGCQLSHIGHGAKAPNREMSKLMCERSRNYSQ